MSLVDELRSYVEPDDDSEDRGAIRTLMVHAADRIDELLKVIRHMSAQVPYAEESGNTAVLIAAVGTLKARVAKLHGLLDRALKHASDGYAQGWDGLDQRDAETVIASLRAQARE